MSQPVTTFADLMRCHPVFQAFVNHFAECPFISLNGLWELSGNAPNRDPVAWLDGRGDHSAGQVGITGNHVVADEMAAWEYLTNTDPTIGAVALHEVERQIAANPIDGALFFPHAMIVSVARHLLAKSQGMTDAEACAFLVDAALTRTADWPDWRRESLVAQLQRAIAAVESNTQGVALQTAAADYNVRVYGLLPGFHPWYIPKPDLALLRPSTELDLLCPV